ncbi:elongator complex protein 6 [Ranitomeya imitator]|uniref:elongator complex protein 6 n=1 Tax=Ranitomeya imitator TaxID=111125 RepID=UPI0037E87736
MYPELNGLLGADPESPERRQFTLISGHKTDAGFLLHHFLSYYLKAGCRVCFVALAQSFSHYNIIGQKLGVSLLSCRDRGQLSFLEGLRSYTRLLLTETPETEAENPLRFLRTGSDLRPLYDFITAALAPSAGEQWKCPVLIIDDVSVLLSLGVTTLQVQDLLHYCRASVCHRYQGAVVCLLQGGDGSEDSDHERLLKSLWHQSGLFLQVEGLVTGFCKDVHGQLTITWRIQERHRTLIYQYKIHDKTVTFFARGLSGAVL